MTMALALPASLGDAAAYLPHVLLALLVGVILYLFALDALNGARRPFLRPDRWQPLPLVDKVELTHNTRRLRFALPHREQWLGLPVGQHISLRLALPGGGEVMRPYTPTSDPGVRGHVDFVVKVYPEGRMTRALDALPLGSAAVHFKGPRGKFEYRPRAWRALGFVVGGTGITPAFQLLQRVLKDPNDPTRCVLVFGNLTEADILLRPELDELAARNPGRLAVHHVLNTPPPTGWAGGAGFITEEMLRRWLPPPGEGVLVARCGPPPMMRAMEAHLDAIGYPKEQQFQF